LHWVPDREGCSTLHLATTSLRPTSSLDPDQPTPSDGELLLDVGEGSDERARRGGGANPRAEDQVFSDPLMAGLPGGGIAVTGPSVVAQRLNGTDWAAPLIHREGGCGNDT
jgi:hypothetical protein